MRLGRIIPGSLPPLSEVWELAQANLRALPEPYRALTAPEPYPVRFSDAMRTLRAEASALAASAGRVAPATDGAADEPIIQDGADGHAKTPPREAKRPHPLAPSPTGEAESESR
jgi:hypothetical protein